MYYLLLLAWNIAVAFLYGADKYRAKTRQYRFSEKTLLTCTFLFGGIGGCIGVFILRHKSKHIKFLLLVPLFLVLQGIAFYFLLKNSTFAFS